MVSIWHVIPQAAWPVVVILMAHGILGGIFGHDVDPVMHLFGGAAAAFFFIQVPRLIPKIFGEPIGFYKRSLRR